MPVQDLGYQGACALVDLIDGKRKQARHELDPIRLVVRASTAAPA